MRGWADYGSAEGVLTIRGGGGSSGGVGWGGVGGGGV